MISLTEIANSSYISLFAAGLFGSLLGLEREARDKGAGLRTHTLVSLGSCLFTVVSVESVADLANGDPTRIASQIVSGIGFLGGGAILQDRDKVHGLTTAATIWIAAAIGMACGMRQLIEGFAVTVMTLVFLLIFRRLSKSVRKPRSTWLLTIHLTEDLSEGDFAQLENGIESSLREQGFKLLELSEKSRDKLEFVIRGQNKLSTLIRELKAFLPRTTEIDFRET